MTHYCNKCEQAMGREEEASLVDGKILCLDCLDDKNKPAEQPISECTCRGSCSCRWEYTQAIAKWLCGDTSQDSIDKAYEYIEKENNQ